MKAILRQRISVPLKLPPDRDLKLIGHTGGQFENTMTIAVIPARFPGLHIFFDGDYAKGAVKVYDIDGNFHKEGMDGFAGEQIKTVIHRAFSHQPKKPAEEGVCRFHGTVDMQKVPIAHIRTPSFLKIRAPKSPVLSCPGHRGIKKQGFQTSAEFASYKIYREGFAFPLCYRQLKRWNNKISRQRKIEHELIEGFYGKISWRTGKSLNSV